MRKRAAQLIVACSAAVFALTAASWRRSYTTYDRAGWARFRFAGDSLTKTSRQVLAVRGSLLVDWSRDVQPPLFHYLSAERRRETESLPRLFWRSDPPRVAPDWRPGGGGGFSLAAGFACVSGSWQWRHGWWVGPSIGHDVYWRSQRSGMIVVVPHWFVCGASAICPVIAMTRLGRRRRASVCARSGRCSACGYDLRATPGRCPECGTIQPPDGESRQKLGTGAISPPATTAPAA